ncbi:MAG: hypothetical protein NVS4B8_25980 [Herpetosiphon sp.]
MQSLCLPDHFRRDVDAAHLHAQRIQVSGDLTGTATEVADRPRVPSLFGQQLQHVAVEGLVGEFVVVVQRVISRYTIIALLNV